MLVDLTSYVGTRDNNSGPPHSQRRESPSWRFPLGSSTSNSRNPAEEGGGIVGSRGVMNTMTVCPAESTKQCSWGLTKNKATISESAWICAKSSAYVLWLLSWCFGENPDSESWGVAGYYLLLGPLFSYWAALPSLDVRVCVYSYWMLCRTRSLGGLLFSEGRWEWSASAAGETGSGDWEVVIGMCSMRKE